MNAVELERELWEINNELVKADIEPWRFPNMAAAVAELVKRYNELRSQNVETSKE